MKHRYRHEVGRVQKKKKLFTLKRLIIAVVALILAYVALFLIVVPERPNYAFFAGKEPMIVAHQGGSSLAPKNTLVAFEKAKSLGVDAIHFEVRMSKDAELVVIEEDKVDSTTNGTGKVSELTLAELKSLDAAYRFPGIRGNYEYRGHGVTIPTVKEVFEKYRGMNFFIEMKETKFEKEEGEEEDPLQGSEYNMAQRLWELIEEYSMEKRVVVSADSSALLQEFMLHAQDRVILTASAQETTRFTILHKLFLNRLYRPQSDVLQVSSSHGIFNMNDGRILEGAERLNMKILYQVINERSAESMMRELLKNGANGIITDRPDLLIRVINEMGLKDGSS